MKSVPEPSNAVAATVRDLLGAAHLSAADAMAIEAGAYGKADFGEAAAAAVMERTSDRLAGLDEGEKGRAKRIIAAIYATLLQHSDVLEGLKHRVWAVVLALPARVSELSERVEALLRAASIDLALDPGIRAIPDADLPESWLLRPEFEMVPFHSVRDHDVQRIVEWALTDTKLSVRLVTAPGGYGKTRLAAMAAEMVRRQGWKAGFIRPQVDRMGQAAVETVIGDRTMLIIDYAEGRTELLASLLARAAGEADHLRLLLLARAKADWWDVLMASNSESGRILRAATSFHPLANLPDNVGVRADIFRKAATAFGAKQALEPPPLEDEDFGRMLYLQMAALAAARGRHLLRGDELLEDAVQRERRFWALRLQSLGMNPQHRLPLVSQAVAAVTTVGGCASRSELNDLIGGLPLAQGLPAIDVDAVASLIGSLYPTPGELGALRPDLLGEQLLAEEMEREPTLFLRLLTGEA
ncbi:P-loop NTPase [Rhizobium leguminosarum]|uniref:P-loop NTPase n=1 Tax=Rhizobium leguminosarum TaxID=384 RepID=UPI003F973244